MIVILVIIGFVGWFVLHSNHQTSPKSNLSNKPTSSPQNKESAAVKAAYKQTSDQAANLILSDANNPQLYGQQINPLDTRNGRTNEISNLYCFTVESTPDLVPKIVTGFNKNTLGTWTYDGQDYTKDSVRTPDTTVLHNRFQQTGTVNLTYETSHNDKLKTNNPDYYPSALASLTATTPQQANNCSQLAIQNKTNTTNKVVVSLSLDLYDWVYEF